VAQEHSLRRSCGTTQGTHICASYGATHSTSRVSYTRKAVTT
jgi:hypothetical protein